jgi:hypothetical protein
MTPIEKAHFGTEIGDRQKAMDRERLTLLPQRHGTHPERADEPQRFRTESNQPFLDRGTVRRGVWFIFWSSLLSNEKKCGCIFFEPKAER